MRRTGYVSIVLAAGLALAAAPAQPLPVRAAGTLGEENDPPRYVFPVPGRVSFATGHVHAEYPATDIMAACGHRVRAVTDGVVLEVDRVDDWDPAVDNGATRGGKSVSILGKDGVRYYGSHFSSIVPGLKKGSRVWAGRRIARVGATGRASGCHVHFGISPPCRRTKDWWIRRGVVWPGHYLASWHRGRNRSPAPEVRRWRAEHGCPRRPS